MLVIRLLGGFHLALDAGAAPGRLGPKLQGLISMLAMSRGDPVARGRLAGLLWGERDEDLARHSLSQALTTIRRTIGPDASALLIAEPESVRLATGSVRLDVDEFELAARSQQADALATAARLYRGEFLEGLEIDEPGFEEWLLTERHRLEELAAVVFGRLLESQTAAGTIDAAVETARRLIAVTPFDEAAHARLLQLYGLQGRRGLAEAHYARCGDLLRRELGEAPGAELRAALSEARRRSHVRAGQAAGGAGMRPGAGASSSGRLRTRVWRAVRQTPRATAAVAALLVAAFVGGGFYAMPGRDDEAGSSAAAWDLPAQPSVAVLPFVNLSGDPRQDWLADGITRDIITDLSRFSTLFVIAASSTFRYKGGKVGVRDVARELGVRYVLEGSILRADEVLRLAAALVDATTGRHVWAERYEGPAGDLFTTQKEVSRSVATLIGSERGVLLQAELERIARTPTSSLVAYEFFQRGVHYRNLETEADTVIARRMFERAIELDPNYARAVANLGMTHLDDIWGHWTASRDRSLQQARDLAGRATAIDASEPLGYVVLGLARFLDAQYGEAVPLLDKARALNPNDDHTLHALGYVLFYSAVAPKRGVELLQEVQRRNPHYPEVILRDLAQAYMYARRPNDALAALNQVARRHRPSYWLFKAANHVQLDQMSAARAAVAQALRLDPHLTLEGEHERRLAMGLAPANAEFLTAALRQAGLPARGPFSRRAGR